MAQAQPENDQMEGDQCKIGKIINKWVRDKREECLEMEDGNEEVFGAKVHKALDKLHKDYKIVPLTNGIQGIKYEDPFFQFGYMYKHSMFSARCLSKVMHSSNVSEILPNQTSITVACLGGGPGSDVLGVLDFFMKYMGDFEGELNIRLYDRKDKWGPCWESLKTAMDAELHDPRVKVSLEDFVDFDVTVADSDKNKPDLENADLITMHYFMEEVYSERAKAEVNECFKYILQTAKPSALFLYSGMFMYQVINWVHQLLEAKCEVLPPRPGVPTRNYRDDRGDRRTIPSLHEFNLRGEGDLKLFDDIREDLNRRGNMDLVKVSQRLNLEDGQLVFHLYQKK